MSNAMNKDKLQALANELAKDIKRQMISVS